MSHFDRQKTPTPKLAFPALVDLGTGLQCADFGMTLRDWFAGQALAVSLANIRPQEQPRGGYAEWIEVVARDAYLYADAMMKARDAV